MLADAAGLIAEGLDEMVDMNCRIQGPAALPELLKSRQIERSQFVSLRRLFWQFLKPIEMTLVRRHRKSQTRQTDQDHPNSSVTSI